MKRLGGNDDGHAAVRGFAASKRVRDTLVRHKQLSVVPL